MLNDVEREKFWEAMKVIVPVLIAQPLFSEATMAALWEADKCGCPRCAAFIGRTMDELHAE